MQIEPKLFDPVFDGASRATQLPQEAIHLGLDARDLLQSDLVNLVRREVGSGETAQKIGVRFGSAFQSPQASVIGRAGKLGLKGSDRPFPRRVNLRADDSLGTGTQQLALRGGNGIHRSHLFHECRHERILARRRIDEALHLFDGGFENEARRNHVLRREPARFSDGFFHARAYLSQGGYIVFGIPQLGHRARDGEAFHCGHVPAVHLLQRKAVVDVRLVGDHHLQLPFHYVRGNALSFRHSGPVELAEFGQAFAGKLAPLPGGSSGQGRKLALQPVLLFTREISQRSRQARIDADPFIGEIAKEIVDSTGRRPAGRVLRERGL